MSKNSDYKEINKLYDKRRVLQNTHMIFENLIWLTTVETAIYLRRFTKEGKPSTNSIRTLVCRKKLRARKFLGKLYFKRSELDHLLETSQLKGV